MCTCLTHSKPERQQKVENLDFKFRLSSHLRALQNVVLRAGYVTSMPLLSYNGDAAASAAQFLQSCPTLCNPLWTLACQASLSMGILQARILEWVVMPSSKGSSQPRDRTPGFPYYRWILYYLSHQGPLAHYNNSFWSILLTTSKERLWPYAIVTINLNSFYSKV